MDNAETQSASVARGQSLIGTKRMASDELKNSSDSKRLKTSHDGLATPDVQLPAMPVIIPFPDRVCQDLLNAPKITI